MTALRTQLRGAAVLAALTLAACAGPAPRVEDPAPSGPAFLRRYKESFYRELGDRIVGQLSGDQLLEHIRRCRVLYLGDQHDDRALHRRHLRLLSAIHRAGIEIVLGVEALGIQDDAELQQYLHGRIDLGELRRRVAERWPLSWMEHPQIDAGYYRELLARARRWSMPVFALEPTPRTQLQDRDNVIADNIRDAARQHPGAVVVVVIGHTHLLGQGHLIARVELPAVALGVRPSVSLGPQLAARSAAAGSYLVTSSGILLQPD